MPSDADRLEAELATSLAQLYGGLAEEQLVEKQLRYTALDRSRSNRVLGVLEAVCRDRFRSDGGRWWL